MRFCPHHFLCLALLGGVIAVPSSAPLALEGSQVNQVAKASTILLAGQNPGSGVLIGQQGQTYYVLTAEHVVATEDEYAVVTSDGETYPLNYGEIRKLPKVDLAVVSFNSPKSYPVAPLGNSDQVVEGDRIFIAGWPAAGEAIPHIYQLTSGEISGIAPRPIIGGYGLVYTNVTRAGMSGGPVFNDSGQVIGIHGLAEGRQVALPGYTGDASIIKAGFNMGIPINTFLRLAPQVQLPSGSSITPTPNGSDAPATMPQSGQSARPSSFPSQTLTETQPLTQLIRAPQLPKPAPRVAFTEPPRLLKASTTDRGATNLGATYFFEIDLPATAAAPLQQIDLVLRQGVQYPRLTSQGVVAYEGTARSRGTPLPLSLVVTDPPSRTLTVTFAPPIQPGRQITLAVRPVKNPSVGTYLFEVRGFPQGESAQGVYLGLARLDFVRSSVGQ
jgi:hypothetical protein